MRDQGRLIEWFDDKGYGFIQPHDVTKQKIFVHIKDFAKRGPRPLVGCALNYVVTVDQRGRFCAKDVMYLKTHRQVPKKTSQTSTALPKMVVLIAVYWITLFVLTAMHKLSNTYFFIVILVNVVTYYFYKKDKDAAQHNSWRVKEQNLHMMSFLGGWSAAWFAQQKLRHKTQKSSFQQMYIVTIFLNIALVIFLVSPFNTFLK
ncbi:DUF1294 domain-containing protein [Acinetobacter sp. HY1485]|uniref:DUF1294 domain-containing protein n=1 Tax=Acinetobacter sp. HY1485 TaxID=2970918 RepID=UPI0022B9CEBC|nr:DUF1294 domain-containing protein [Acinetobacter sp. HY1485]